MIETGSINYESIMNEFEIGFNRTQKLIDEITNYGFIVDRKVILNKEEYKKIKNLLI